MLIGGFNVSQLLYAENISALVRSWANRRPGAPLLRKLNVEYMFVKGNDFQETHEQR